MNRECRIDQIGVTLAELLVVLALISVIGGLAVMIYTSTTNIQTGYAFVNQVDALIRAASVFVPLFPMTVWGLSFMFSTASPPSIYFDFLTLATDNNAAVGPFLSLPWEGDIPSDKGSPAFLPFGVAPTIRPNGT